MKFKKINLGDSFETMEKITNSMINDFAKLSGDKNPIHLNDDYAKKTPFGKRVAHGMLIGSLISKVLGMDYPGNGTIYLSQELKFISPVYIDDVIKIIVEVIQIKSKKNILKLKTNCTNEKGDLVVDGTATIKLVK